MSCCILTLLFGPKVTRIEPAELARRLVAGDESLCLVDVREAYERALLPLTVPRLEMPASTLPEAMGFLPTDKDLVLLCPRGRRSALVGRKLLKRGLARAWSLQGGIKAWRACSKTGI